MSGRQREPAPRDRDELDRSFARERTLLAWGRSSLAIAGVGALVIRAGAVSGVGLVAYPVGVAILVLAAAPWLYAQGVYGLRRPAPPIERALALRLTAYATAAFAVVAFVLAVIG
jgi:uncharacterized membrane protein YidH (DUF202 family)